jgi:TRAP-type uncharacterized transport system fused permease subunit
MVATALLYWLGWRLPTAAFWGLMAAVAVAALTLVADRLRNTQSDPANWRMVHALESGGRSVISIAATTACAGVIVSIVTLTGLGLKISGMIVNLGAGNLFFTVLYAALAIWVLGLAVPVTASYIIAAVMIIPALTEVGVPEVAAHMFVFYYAVLADVSPPTALSPFAAAAITGGKPYPTMMLAWKYCLPAFLVPFMFTLSDKGIGLLFLGDGMNIATTFVSACIAIGGLAIGFGGWIFRSANLMERLICGAGGLCLLYASFWLDLVGLALLVVGIGLHWLRVRALLKSSPA